MSGAQVTDTDDRGSLNGAELSAIDPETERIARANGWKPRSEYKGRDPEKWEPADVFLARGFEAPAILQNRNKMLASQVEDLRTQLDGYRLETSTKLDEAVSTIKTLTDMNRTADERAYQRARREITTEIEKAVESGDTQTWKRLEAERTALEDTKPKPVEARQPPPAATAGNPPGPSDPAVQRWLRENPWYDPTNTRPDRDVERMAFADTIHNGLRTTRSNLTMEENLAIVLAEVRNRFPDKFRSAADPNPNPDPDGGRAVANGQDPAANGNGGGDDRRNDPPAVMPSSGTRAGGRRATNRFTFDAMPQESKAAYDRYARVLDGKGAALTKEEWARDYWEQFRDDGNP